MAKKGLRSPDLFPSAVSASAFLAASLALAIFASSTRRFGLIDIVLTLAFAVLVRLEYPIAAGSAVPAQLAFVPMLFLMPLRFVPLAVAVATVLGTIVLAALGRRPTMCPNALGACWFALAPVLILLVAGEHPFAWRHWPLYVVAFLAQSAADLLQAWLWERLVNGMSIRPLYGIFAVVYGFDALLTPVAMVAVADGGYAFLALLPFTGVLYLLARERRERLDAESEADRLGTLAHVDDLTRAANRRSFDAQLVVEQARAGRSWAELSVCLLDLDHFKAYNDTHGHPAGDDLLQRVATAWGETLRPEAMLARLGGEEFGLILPDAGPAAAEAVVQRMRDVTPPEITFSAGIATWNREETISDLVQRADVALYRAKDEGRNRLVLTA